MRLRFQTSPSLHGRHHHRQGLPRAAAHLNLYPACNAWLLPGEPCGLRNPKHSLCGSKCTCPRREHPALGAPSGGGGGGGFPIFQLLILLYFHYILYFYRLFYIKVFLDSVQLLYNKFYFVCTTPLCVFISTRASNCRSLSCHLFLLALTLTLFCSPR